MLLLRSPLFAPPPLRGRSDFPGLRKQAGFGNSGGGSVSDAAAIPPSSFAIDLLRSSKRRYLPLKGGEDVGRNGQAGETDTR